ncbi:MAG: NAD(P)/FAD-dependent oxidoreductase [Myxococcota bacterium]
MTKLLPSTSPFFQRGQAYSGPPLLTADSPATKRYHKPTNYLDKPDAIVIGSGIGGLSVASLLAQRRGMKVLVLEASPVPGGCTHCLEVDGFEFNTGIDSVGDMDPRVGRGLNRDTVDLVTKGTFQWARMPDMHEIVTFGDERYEWFSSPEKNIEWVERLFPGAGNVRRYYELESKVERGSTGWGVSKVMPAWLPEVVREQLFRLLGGGWREYMGKSAWDVFTKECGFSDKLAAVFSYMYGNHGKTPKQVPFGVHAITMYHYRHGAYYPVGGPAQVSECVVPIIQEAGGQVAVRSGVEKILVESGKVAGVKLESGEVIRCPIVVSDASVYTTAYELLDREVAEKCDFYPVLGEVKPSPAHMHLMLGFDEVLDLPEYIIWAMPDSKDVPKYDIDGADVLYKSQLRFDAAGAYILSPSQRDPVYQQRYPGKSTLIALAEAPAEWVTRARNDKAFWAELEGKALEGLMRIVERHVPAIRGKTPKVKTLRLPAGCNPRAWGGCSYGIEGSGPRFVQHTHRLRHKTNIPGLYLTGQDAMAPGFAGSILSGRVAYTAITGDILFML